MDLRQKIDFVLAQAKWFWLRYSQYEKLTSCPICANEEFEFFVKRRWRKLSIKLVRCLTCNLIVQNPRLSTEGLAKFYRDFNRIEASREHWEKLFSRGQRRGSYIVKFLEENKIEFRGLTVCEVGCGHGGILARFREEGCRTIGCDPDPIVVEFGIEKGLEMRFGGIECLIGKTRADILILSHVLEHIEDPLNFLQDAKDLLADDGLIYVEVPGIDDPRVIDNNYSVQPAHLYYFARDTLRDVCELSGFNVLAMNDVCQAIVTPKVK